MGRTNMDHEGSLSELEALIGYTFQDIKHLETAITHKSFVNEKMVGRYMSYERYEFLGDAILEFIVSKYLFENYQTMPEGDLSKLRSSLVCEFTLSKISRDLRFGEFARFSKGERQTGGANRDSILCDMFESVLGAIYLDGGMECATAYLSGIFPAYVLFAFDGPSFSLWSSTTVSGVYPRSSCGVYTSNGLIELPG